MTTVTRSQIIRAAEALNWPTNDAFAASLWRLTSSSLYGLALQDVIPLMRDCGYIPLYGFPLGRAGKIGHMTRAEVEQELESNPLCKLTSEVDIRIKEATR